MVVIEVIYAIKSWYLKYYNEYNNPKSFTSRLRGLTIKTEISHTHAKHKHYYSVCNNNKFTWQNFTNTGLFWVIQAAESFHIFQKIYISFWNIWKGGAECFTQQSPIFVKIRKLTLSGNDLETHPYFCIICRYLPLTKAVRPMIYEYDYLPFPFWLYYGFTVD